jgi:uroporphyrinogen decarboxylase
VTGKERILLALSRRVPDRVPTFEWFIDAAVGKTLTGSEDPIDIVDRLDLDGINIRPDYQRDFLDPTTLIDEWGIKRQLTGDCLPAVRESPINDISDHDKFEFPDPNAPHRFATLERALERFGDEKAVILNLRDGFSDMRDLLGYEAALMALLLQPQSFSELLERAVNYNLSLAAVAKRRFGTTIVATTDDVADATGLLMRPDTYLELIGPMFMHAMRGYRELGYLCIKHCDGNIDRVIDFWVDCGIDCLDPIDPGAGYTLGGMKAKYGERICLKGNVDCTGALCDGTPDEVQAEVRQCLGEAAHGGGLILSSSNTIHRGVVPENYQAMLSAIRQYGAYPTQQD